MANYLKKIDLGTLTAAQIAAVVSFLQSLGMTSAQAHATKNFQLLANGNKVTAFAFTEIDGATDAQVLDDMIAGNVIQLLVR